MKNLLLVGAVGFSLLMSCTAAKTAQNNEKNFLKMKGEWQITSVNYDKSYKIKPFDEGADAQCFVGSQWKLVPNNWTGSYTLFGGGGCPSLTQAIKFEVVDGATFQFKKIAEGTKAKNNTAGYQLSLVSHTDDQFVLQQNIPFDGEYVNVLYNFQRVSNK